MRALWKFAAAHPFSVFDSLVPASDMGMSGADWGATMDKVGRLILPVWACQQSMNPLSLRALLNYIGGSDPCDVIREVVAADMTAVDWASVLDVPLPHFCSSSSDNIATTVHTACARLTAGDIITAAANGENTVVASGAISLFPLPPYQCCQLLSLFLQCA